MTLPIMHVCLLYINVRPDQMCFDVLVDTLCACDWAPVIEWYLLCAPHAHAELVAAGAPFEKPLQFHERLRSRLPQRNVYRRRNRQASSGENMHKHEDITLLMQHTCL